MLDNPTVEYPLYLDPTVGYFAWTMINSQFPNQSYWSFDKWDCPSPFTGECAKVGQVYGATMDYRSMWQFSADAFRGAIVTDAKFTYRSPLLGVPEQQPDRPLGGSTPTSARVPPGAVSASTWAVHVGSVWNYSKPAARKGTEFGITGEIQNIASWGWGSVIYGLKANTETSDIGWKKFDAATARLVVTVNHRPNMPDTLTVDGRSCVAGAGRPVISTATPQLKAHLTDPDGDTMDVAFAWAKWNGSSYVDVGSAHYRPVANGGFGQLTTGTLVHGGIYTFRIPEQRLAGLPGRRSRHVGRDAHARQLRVGGRPAGPGRVDRERGYLQGEQRQLSAGRVWFGRADRTLHLHQFRRRGVVPLGPHQSTDQRC